jgi:alpha-galactosidase
MQFVEHDATRWSIEVGANRYDIELVDGDLRSTSLGPQGTHAPPREENRQNRDNIRRLRPEGAIFVGPQSDRVTWTAAAARIDGTTFHLALTSDSSPLSLDWRLWADPTTGALIRQGTIRHGGGAPVTVTGALSLSTRIVGPVLGITTISGAWAAEGQVRHVVPDHTPILLESRSGKTGFEYQPWIAVETPGAVTIVALWWSGNWQIHARDHEDGISVSAGLPEAGFQAILHAGEVLDLPEAMMLRVEGDMNAAVQRLHDLRRGLQTAGRPVIPVQFNTWYPFPGKPQVDDLLALLPRAAALGAEVFVLDGGWYDNAAAQPDDDPWELTGDWLVHRGMFPNGLGQLADACRDAGMDFGIWFEPEGIGYSAALRHERPEWFHQINGQPPQGRHRGLLNFGIAGAREHARDAMLRILRDTGARWLKWDFNEDLLRGGWHPATDPNLSRRDPLVAHYEGVYLLQEELHAALPDLVIEMCASGGGRFDGRILRHAHTEWMSDQWEPLKNLSIHFGLQMCHPPEFCNDWLIEWPVRTEPGRHGEAPDARGDLAFRLRVAMLGSFGISARIGDWPEGDIETAAAEVAWYKSVARPLVGGFGDQYILTPAPRLDGTGGWAAMWFAAKDQTGGFALIFRLEATEGSFVLRLDGLDPARRYCLSMPGEADRHLTGAALAEGQIVTIALPYLSQRVTVTAI